MADVRRFFRDHQQKVGIAVSLGILALFVVFVAGFTFAHGVCCGDDADLALKAKGLIQGDFRNLYVGFDPHVGIILPIAGMIKLVGVTYWAPGLAILLVDAVLLVLIGLFLKKYQIGLGFVLIPLIFLGLNYFLLSRHFEQWYAALGEVPAALLIILAVLCFYHGDHALFPLASGVILTWAILTKVATIIALGAFLLAIIVQGLVLLVKKEPEEYSKLGRKLIFLLLGVLIPLAFFSLAQIFLVGWGRHLNRTLNTISYAGNYLTQHQVVHPIQEFIDKKIILEESFSVPLWSLPLILVVAGVFIKGDQDLVRIAHSFLSIIIFYTIWWFFFSIGWGRHFIVPILLIIFSLTLPFLTIRAKSMYAIYTAVLVLWSLFTWQHANYPFRKLDGPLYRPSSNTQALIQVSSLLSSQANKELIVTKRHGTYEDIQYLSKGDLNFKYFESNRQYKVPFWVAVKTEWVAVNEGFLKYSNEKTFKRFLSRCTGLRDYEGYLVGRCE